MNSYTRYTLKNKKRKIKTFKSYTIYTITSHQFKQFVRSGSLSLGEDPADTDAQATTALLSSTQQSNHSPNVRVRKSPPNEQK